MIGTRLSDLSVRRLERMLRETRRILGDEAVSVRILRREIQNKRRAERSNRRRPGELAAP